MNRSHKAAPSKVTPLDSARSKPLPLPESYREKRWAGEQAARQPHIAHALRARVGQGLNNPHLNQMMLADTAADQVEGITMPHADAWYVEGFARGVSLTTQVWVSVVAVSTVLEAPRYQLVAYWSARWRLLWLSWRLGVFIASCWRWCWRPKVG